MWDTLQFTLIFPFIAYERWIVSFVFPKLIKANGKKTNTNKNKNLKQPLGGLSL